LGYRVQDIKVLIEPGFKEPKERHKMKLIFVIAIVLIIPNSVHAQEPNGIFRSDILSVNNLTAVQYNDTYNILGIITNISNDTLNGIKLSLEVYNSTNNLIGLTQGSPTYTILEPGQSSTFEILSDVGRLNGFDHYIIKTGYYASFS
jgi:hypothetical protein